MLKTKKIRVFILTFIKTPKIKSGNFLKMDIFKMSIFQKLASEFSGKSNCDENAVNTKKIILVCYDKIFAENGQRFFSFYTLEPEVAIFVAMKYLCETCDYKTSKICDMNKHLSTRKHIFRTFSNFSNENVAVTINADIPTTFSCKKCNKQYKAKNSLWYHEKKCQVGNDATCVVIEQPPNSIPEKVVDNPEPQQTNISEHLSMITELLKQNQDLQRQMIEMSKETQTCINNVNTVNNTINNQFNLNVFLNEKCKDAVNLTDFVNSLQISLSDFEATGRLGYAEGISQIIINGLRKMDVNKRPVHCTDSKRETLYVKDKDMWEKENATKTKLTNAVKVVANKNLQVFQEWQSRYPESIVNNTKENQHLVKIMLAVLGGRTPEEEQKYQEKILRNIAKEVIIDKE